MSAAKGSEAKKDATLNSTSKSAAMNMQKAMSTPQKIITDDQSVISSPELQHSKSDMPVNMEQSTTK